MTGPSSSASASAVFFSAPVSSRWMFLAPRSTGAVSVRRGSGAPGARIAIRLGASSASAAASWSAPGNRLAVCISAPMPSTRTSIGRAASMRSRSASITSSGALPSAVMGTNCAFSALLCNNKRRISAVLERSELSGTNRSSLSITLTRGQSRSAFDSAAKNGPGVVPPGTTSVALGCAASTSRNWSATRSARSRISCARSG